MDFYPVFLVLFVMCAASVIQAKQVGNDASCSPQLSIEASKLPLKVGDDVIIKCRVCGHKDTFWFKDGKRFGETRRVHWIQTRKISSYPVVVEGKLRIEKLRKRDSGVYKCYAVNFFATGSRMEEGEIKLVVKSHHHNPLAYL